MLRRHTSTIVIVIFLVGWFFYLRPTVLAGPASYVIVSGVSMEPTLIDGDLVVLRRQPEYGVGDVVAFQTDGGNVIHRIVDREGKKFIMQGDNKTNIDPWTPQAGDILGKLWLYIPQAGELIEKLHEPLWLAVFIAIICFILLL